MAGGMNKRGGFGIPMAQRVALRDGVDPCPARHCWVLDPADHTGQRRPGLFVEWRHTDEDEWLGRVIYSAQIRAGEWMTLEEWLCPRTHWLRGQAEGVNPHPLNCGRFCTHRSVSTPEHMSKRLELGSTVVVLALWLDDG